MKEKLNLTLDEDVKFLLLDTADRLGITSSALVTMMILNLSAGYIEILPEKV